MANRSTFPNSIDQFRELFDLPPSQIANARRYQELKSKTSLIPNEQTELNNLTQILQDYLITPEKWNFFQDCLYNMENFLLNETIVFTDNLKNETRSYVDAKKSELQAELDKFTHRGEYNPTTQYYKKNIVTYQGETYLCLQDTLGNVPNPNTNTPYWAKIAARGEQGQKGDPGVGLVFRGSYNPTTTYNPNDAVEYNGSVFYCINTTVGEIPDTSSPNWELFIARGSILVSSTPPVSPTDKMVWIDSNNNIFKYYNSSSSSWVELNAKDADTLDGKHLSEIQADYNNKIGNLSNLNTTDKSNLVNAFNAHLAETASKFTNINLNIIDMAVELETLKGATLNGVTANIFIETFTNLNDINLMNGGYDSVNKRLVV